MDNEKVFVDGMIFNKKHDNAPDFIKGHIAVKVEEFVPFIEKHKKDDGWVNIDLKLSKGGKLYFELNTWKPENKKDSSDIGPGDIPF